FSESGVHQNNGLPSTAPSGKFSADNPPSVPIRRVNTGVSSIVGANNGERPGGFVLVIDGPALEQVRSLLCTQRSHTYQICSQALSDDENKSLLLRLATHCEGVICCRVSPLQKALVVKLV